MRSGVSISSSPARPPPGRPRSRSALARRLGGEIVNADSQQVYRGLDVGTAKPTADGARRGAAPPRSTWPSRGRGWTPPASPRSPTPPSRTSRRAGGSRSWRAAPGSTCARSSTASWRRPGATRRSGRGSRRRRRGSVGPRSTRGSPRSIPRRRRASGRTTSSAIVRALEIAAGGRTPSELHAAHAFSADRYDALLLALDPPRAELHARIDARVREMFAGGLLDEARALLERASAARCPRSCPSATPRRSRCVRGDLAVEEAIRRVQVAHRRYARRQVIWLRRERGRRVARAAGRRRGVGAARRGALIRGARRRGTCVRAAAVL